MDEKPDSLMDFIVKYKGAIIGGAIAVLLVCTGLFKLLVALIVIAGGIYAKNSNERTSF